MLKLWLIGMIAAPSVAIAGVHAKTSTTSVVEERLHIPGIHTTRAAVCQIPAPGFFQSR